MDEEQPLVGRGRRHRIYACECDPFIALIAFCIFLYTIQTCFNSYIDSQHSQQLVLTINNITHYCNGDTLMLVLNSSNLSV
jgi:hypothetical protein